MEYLKPTLKKCGLRIILEKNNDFKSIIYRNFMVEMKRGVLIPHPPAVSLRSDFIDSTVLEFTAIGRKMVSNLVSNSPWGYTPMSAIPPYWVTVFVPDPRLGFWKCQFRRMRLKGCC